MAHALTFIHNFLHCLEPANGRILGNRDWWRGDDCVRAVALDHRHPLRGEPMLVPANRFVRESDERASVPFWKIEKEAYKEDQIARASEGQVIPGMSRHTMNGLANLRSLGGQKHLRVWVPRPGSKGAEQHRQDEFRAAEDRPLKLNHR